MEQNKPHKSDKAGLATRGANSEQRHGSASFTFATLAAVVSELSEPLPWRYCVMKPEHAEILRREVPSAQPSQLPIIGIEIFEKPGQVADSWMFREAKTLRKYLVGELSELDLIALMETGACEPNAKVSDRCPAARSRNANRGS